MTAVAEQPTQGRSQGPAREPVPPIRARRRPRVSRPPTSGDETASVLSSVFMMVAIFSLWMAAQLLFLGGLSESRDQDLLYRDFRTELALGVGPVGPVAPVGSPVALLTATSIGLQQVVVEGTASGDLLAGPGHRRDTVLPGQEGVSVVYGRGATYGAPFAAITRLEPGEPLEVVVGQGRLVFHVLGVRREGDPLPPAPEAGVARLTLVTAEGEGRLAAISAGSAVYVDAEAVKAFPAPAGRPVAVPESEMAMATDPGALPLLALCLALLLAVTFGVVVTCQRWSAVLVWVIASPVVIALSWASTDVVMRLLPNLI